MNEIQVYDRNGAPITELRQYDRDVLVHIREPGVASAVPVHFFNRSSKQALVVKTEYAAGTLKAKIPNILLEDDLPVTGYLYVTTDTESRSLYGFTITVRHRPIPGDFVHVESKDYVTLSEIEESCRKYAENANTAKSGAESAKTEATKQATAAGESAKAAAASAATAKTDAATATTAKSDAVAAKNGIETARDAAVAAQKAAEKAKADVEALKYRKVETTIQPTEWTGSASPYTATITVPNLTATQLVFVHNAMNLTAAQITAFADAGITAGTQTAGQITLKAVNKPTVALPVVIEMGGDIAT